MREILFRGKRTDNGEWVEGYLTVSGDDDKTLVIDYIPPNVNCYCQTEVDPSAVGQYTGLQDKNGKRIFEGDVVCLDEEVKEIFNVEDGAVKYGWGGFYVKEFGVLCSLNTLS